MKEAAFISSFLTTPSIHTAAARPLQGPPQGPTQGPTQGPRQDPTQGASQGSHRRAAMVDTVPVVGSALVFRMATQSRVL